MDMFGAHGRLDCASAFSSGPTYSFQFATAGLGVSRSHRISHCLVLRIAHIRYHLFLGYEAIQSWGFVASFGMIWPIKTIPSHWQLPPQSKYLFQSNCIHLSHPPTPVFSRLASYHYSRSCRYRYGSFPSAEVREYAYDGLYSMVYLGMGRPNHICILFRGHMIAR